MNHAGEIGPLVAARAPARGADHHHRARPHRDLGSIEAIADAKAEIFEGLEPGGAAILNRDAPQYERLAAAAQARGAAVLTFGSSGAADAALFRSRRPTAARASRRASSAATLASDRRARRAYGSERARLPHRRPRARRRRRGARRGSRAFSRRRAGGSASRWLRPAGRSADRRELQRQSRLNARSAEVARRGEARPERTPNCGHRRDAGARRRRGCDARGARRRPRRREGRSALRRGAADPGALRGRASAIRAPGRRRRARSKARSHPRCAPATSRWSRARTRAGWARWSKRSAGASRTRAREAKRSDADLALRLDASSGRLPPVPLADLPHPRGGRDGALPRALLRPDDHLAPPAEAGEGPADPHRRAGVASSHQEGHADDGRAHDPLRAHRLVAALGGPGDPYVWIVLFVTFGFGGDRLLRRLPQGDEAVASRLFRPFAACRANSSSRARLPTPSCGSAAPARPRSRCPSSTATCSTSAGASCCSARS